jgi:starch-binding outer membrane protein, SusD/RagB family
MSKKISYSLFISIRLLILITILLQISCKKYLDKKPVQNLAVPSSLNDLQAVLDNQTSNSNSCAFLEFVADNYYLSTTTWNNLPEDLRRNFIWATDAAITNNSAVTWGNPYKSVYESNFVLDILPSIKIDESERSIYNSIKGSALFSRAFKFHELAQLFCKPFTSTADTDLGIILKLSSDVNDPVSRSTVKQTYDQIINDLQAAAELLPNTSLYNTRPTKAAAYALLSRVYLSMRDYANASINANLSLNFTNTLLDYNALTPLNNPELPVNSLNNPEILFQCAHGLAEIFNSSRTAIVDSNLYKSYSGNDLRKTIFYGLNANGTAYWKGSYYTYSNYTIFDGIAIDEVYLTRAECRTREGDINGAMEDLNLLLRNRYKTGTFANLNAINTVDALNKILIERRKELAFRGVRWSDLRRLNLEGANITLSRRIDNGNYSLPANDLRWILLIPDGEISRLGIPQNQRQ